MKVHDAVTMLFEDTGRFLERNMIIIAGAMSRASQLSIFQIRSGGYRSIVTPHCIRKVQYWRINVLSDRANRVLTSTDDYTEFRAFYVAMKQIDQELSTTHFALPSEGGTDLMLTSQLTGCTFGRGSQSVGGACVVSHIQPPKGSVQGPVAGVKKAAMKMKVRSGIGEGGAILETAGGSSTSVVGKRDAGTWQFINQTVNRSTNVMTTTAL